MTYSNQSYRIIIQGDGITFSAYDEEELKNSDHPLLLFFESNEEGIESLVEFIREKINGQTPIRKKLN